MLETHLAEVKLLDVVVPSVAQPAWQNVAAQLAVFHETVGFVESSQTTHTTLGRHVLHLFSNFPNSAHITFSDAAHVSAIIATSSVSTGVVL